MKIMSAIYWRTGLRNAANPNSVMLKIAESKQGNLVMALVCTGDIRKLSANGNNLGANDVSSAIASGYMVEEMTKWFDRTHLLIMMRNKSVRWIRKNLDMEIKRINDELRRFGEKQDVLREVSAVIPVVIPLREVCLRGDHQQYPCDQGHKEL